MKFLPVIIQIIDKLKDLEAYYHDCVAPNKNDKRENHVRTDLAYDIVCVLGPLGELWHRSCLPVILHRSVRLIGMPTL